MRHARGREGGVESTTLVGIVQQRCDECELGLMAYADDRGTIRNGKASRLDGLEGSKEGCSVCLDSATNTALESDFHGDGRGSMFVTCPN